jgi:hypothetical protein
VDLNEIWRVDLVRGFSGDPSQGACLLTVVSWLVDGKLTDRLNAFALSWLSSVAMPTIFCTKGTGSDSEPSSTGWPAVGIHRRSNGARMSSSMASCAVY